MKSPAAKSESGRGQKQYMATTIPSIIVTPPEEEYRLTTVISTPGKTRYVVPSWEVLFENPNGTAATVVVDVAGNAATSPINPAQIYTSFFYGSEHYFTREKLLHGTTIALCNLIFETAAAYVAIIVYDAEDFAAVDARLLHLILYYKLPQKMFASHTKTKYRRAATEDTITYKFGRVEPRPRIIVALASSIGDTDNVINRVAR